MASTSFPRTQMFHNLLVFFSASNGLSNVTPGSENNTVAVCFESLQFAQIYNDNLIMYEVLEIP